MRGRGGGGKMLPRVLSVPKKAWMNRVKKRLKFVAVAGVVLKINISSAHKKTSIILTHSPLPIRPMDVFSEKIDL